MTGESDRQVLEVSRLVTDCFGQLRHCVVKCWFGSDSGGGFICGVGRKRIPDRDVSPWRKICCGTSWRPFGGGRVQRITGGDGFDHSDGRREGLEKERSRRREGKESRLIRFGDRVAVSGLYEVLAGLGSGVVFKN